MRKMKEIKPLQHPKFHFHVADTPTYICRSRSAEKSLPWFDFSLDF
jgi:hypothetical protein